MAVVAKAASIGNADSPVSAPIAAVTRAAMPRVPRKKPGEAASIARSDRPIKAKEIARSISWVPTHSYKYI